MAVCPLCSDRPAKRYCPAKAERICAVCCGTKREIEIDCPGDCPYLRSGRDYEAEKHINPEVAAKAHHFDEEFLYRFAPVLDAISRAILVERAQSPWLVDNDLIEVFKSLTVTMKTLSNGIYYESQPDSMVGKSLFRSLQGLFDQMMQPQEDPAQDALKVSQLLDILDFLTIAAYANSSLRPRSRQYLDWLASMTSPESPPERSSGLILP